MIRIAVNLLLILAMLLQPLAVVGFTATAPACGAQGSVPAMCAGCGCCQASQANRQCCCCGKAGSHTADRADGHDGEAVLPAKQFSSLSLCLCGKRHQSLPNRSAPTKNFELSDSVVQSLESFCCYDDSVHRRHLSVALFGIARAPHYAQQYLSVWLI